jgi:hypothetical protein
MTGRRWCAPILAGAVLAAASLLVGGPDPAAASDGPCPGTTGVTVVVDYNALGGGVVVRCAPGTPSSGFKALKAAGFAVTPQQDQSHFLCRIDGQPGPDREDCLGTPPGNAYWAYWHAERGGSKWTYNPWGADHKPAQGGVDGWSFQSGGSAVPPGISPPALPPAATPGPTPTPTPRATATPRPTASPTARPTPSGSASTATPAGSPSPSGLASTPIGSPGGSSGASAAASDAASGPPDATDPPPSASSVDAAAVVGSGSDPGPGSPTSTGGPPIGTLIGLVLVVLVAAGALSARRRRPAGGAGGG